ncbi:unnamed protein product [Chilo suppressalis]|uniref:RRM domain-containing protein n=1 Tax=Chilo suppressalis TaxID=168631 RepID=A0ABN8B0V4_CHISP|nr:unnamed protein product [Chilo suppressalis]
MSKVLLIRHLPKSLSIQDKAQLLRHFGAVKVWEKSPKFHYVFALFPNVDVAKSSLMRLHQLEIAKRRLVVEYSFENEPTECNYDENETSSAATKQIKKFLQLLNAWNPSVNLYQPPPAHLNYKYPNSHPNTLINIIYALLNHKAFYTQALHLMNKMSLSLPFEENKTAISLFKDTFRYIFKDEIAAIPPPASETESELSSDESEKQTNKPVPTSIKRLHKLPVTRKRPAAILSTANLPKAKKVAVSQEEVFENVTPLPEPKKIAVFVNQDALSKPSEEPEIIGELGKFEKEAEHTTSETIPLETEEPPITRKELLQNRLNYSDMKVLPVFKNYHPGQPSMRLYIKNLAKSVTDQDVKRIYKHYVNDMPDEENIGFDVRVMQEGKMKGQAFVTFPSAKIAEVALNETNGFILKDKPMVVQFARAANKRTVE